MFKHLAVSGALLLALSTGAAAQTRLLLNCFTPPSHVWCEVVGEWAERVNTATEGRVQIVIPAQSLAPPPEQLHAVRSGLFDISFIFNGFAAEEVAGPMVAMNPFVSSSSSLVNSIALWRTYEEHLAVLDEYDGVHLLGLAVNPGANFYSMTEEPILSLADATGRRMWALPGATSRILINNDGAVTSGPAAQMTEIIQRGVVDGFVGVPPETAIAFNVMPYATSVTRTPRAVFSAVFSFFINEDAWNGLSDEDQAAIMSVSGAEFAQLTGEMFDRQNGIGIAHENEELEVFEASDAFFAELQAAGVPITQAWIGRVNGLGADGAAALDYYQAQVMALIAERTEN